MENTLQSTNLLAVEVTSYQSHYVSQEIKKEKIEALEENSKKVNKLITAANQIQLQFSSLNEDNNVLRNIAQKISIKVLYEM